VASQTPYNPVSNFGQNTMGNFRAVSFSRAIFLTPPSLSAKGFDNQIELSWEGNEYFKTYNLYWDTKSGVDENSNIINDIAAPVDNKPGKYLHKSLTKGTTYFYRVQALDEAGNSSPLSTEISVIADGEVGSGSTIFTNLKATPGSGQITLSWDPIDGAAKYYIYWDTKTGVDNNSKLIYEENLNSPYTHSGLTSGQTYYYRIATNISNTEYLSEEISAKAE